MKILLAFGTRPEWIKIKPLFPAFKESDINYECLFTGQHTDLIKEHSFDYKISISENNNNRLNQVISDILTSDIKWSEFDYVLVQGDTASAYAVALAAYNNKVRVIHLEAGLRSYDLDNPYPEESYRQMISRIASINFCPTNQNKNNLINEKVSGEIYVVGNTVLDNILGVESSYGKTVLVTMHRRENHDLLPQWFSEISKLAEENKNLKFILPLHPNPNVQACKEFLKGVKVVEPFSYEEMIKQMARCRLIISDSGGIQEEASFLHKKVIVCRKTTERMESVGVHSFMCGTPDCLKEQFDKLKNDYKVTQTSPYGYGISAKHIAKILNKYKILEIPIFI
tara:strand:+ start:58 stop:1077 length:1020 start_codon:yes stop_codon:yes gene_type:complete